MNQTHSSRLSESGPAAGRPQPVSDTSRTQQPAAQRSRSNPRRKPVYIARSGVVRVPVNRHGKNRYVVTWREFKGAPRKRETFGIRADAVRRADEIARSIATGLGDVITLTSADRDHYRHAVLALVPLGISLHAAIEEYTAARHDLKGAALNEAVQAWHREQQRAAAQTKTPPSAEILAQLLDACAANGRSELHRSDLKSRLTPFVQEFPDLSAIGQRDLFQWLNARRAKGQPISARTRDNYRNAIAQLFRFAQANQWLPAGPLATDGVSRISISGDITTYSTAEFTTILRFFAAHRREWLPFAAIGGLAGLRTSEIMRLEWSAIHWDAAAISVSRNVAKKVRRARVVPMCPALLEWLGPWRNAVSSLYTGVSRVAVDRKRDRAISALEKATGMEWKPNALRHSYGSYRLAVVKSIDQVALEMGNSPAKVREHYNDPKFTADGVKWFEVRPLPAENNIITLQPMRSAP